jgi:hypothetical protein
MRILCQCSFLIFAVTQVVAQANIVQPPPKPQPPARAATPPPGSSLPVCDRNGVLLDVLNAIAKAQFVKEETDYEKSKKLDEDAIYRRRLQVIKALASKK